jgi:NAD+ synthase
LLAQSQAEFFFGLAYRELDLCLYALDHHTPQGEVATATGMTVEQVERVFRDIAAKRRVAEILRRAPILMES